MLQGRGGELGPIGDKGRRGPLGRKVLNGSDNGVSLVLVLFPNTTLSQVLSHSSTSIQSV